MGSRYYNRSTRKFVGTREAGLEVFIERMRKMRALNCSPSDVGVDSFTLRKFIVGKWSNVMKTV